MTVIEKIRPLVTNEFATPDGKMHFSASCFGGINWSLARLQKNSDVYLHPEFADQLCSALLSVEANCAYAPNPTEFNGVVDFPIKLADKLSLGNGVFVRRNKSAPMDGTFLSHRRDAGIFSAGGCGVIVATYRHQMIFAHAGRPCLLDPVWVKSEGLTQGRKNISVVDSIIEAFGVPKELMHEVHFWLLYFIKPEDFAHRADDKVHDSYNRAAISFLPCVYGKECGDVTSERILIDLPRIARMQCIQHGVPSGNIHTDHAYLADDLPHTRKGEGTTRYLVAIVRKS